MKYLIFILLFVCSNIFALDILTESNNVSADDTMMSSASISDVIVVKNNTTHVWADGGIGDVTQYGNNSRFFFVGTKSAFMGLSGNKNEYNISYAPQYVFCSGSNSVFRLVGLESATELYDGFWVLENTDGTIGYLDIINPYDATILVYP